MLSVKYYLISPQQAYNILLALFCINCRTFDVPQVPMGAKKTKIKIKNFEIYYVQVSPVQLIYHESRYT